MKKNRVSSSHEQQKECCLFKTEQFHVLLLLFFSNFQVGANQTLQPPSILPAFQLPPTTLTTYIPNPQKKSRDRKLAGVVVVAVVALAVVVVFQLYENDDDDGHEAPFAPLVFFPSSPPLLLNLEAREAFSILQQVLLTPIYLVLLSCTLRNANMRKRVDVSTSHLVIPQMNFFLSLLENEIDAQTLSHSQSLTYVCLCVFLLDWTSIMASTGQ